MSSRWRNLVVLPSGGGSIFLRKTGCDLPLAAVRRTRATPVATTTAAMTGPEGSCFSSRREPVAWGRRESEARPHPSVRGRGHEGGGA